MEGYHSQYRAKLTTPEKAVADLKDGSTIVPGIVAAEPAALLTAIANRARQGDLKDIKVYFLHPEKYMSETVLSPDLCDCIQTYSFFVGGADRSATSVGLNYFIPNYFHQIPRLIKDFMEVDLAITTVSPMDKSGYFSFGTSNDYTSTAARCARKLVVEVNKNMPRTFGDSILHISEVDAIVESDFPLFETREQELGAEDITIGKRIAEMVPDGATIQLGAGNVPNAVAQLLTDHKDLGVHTELFCSGLVDLIEKGVITGRKKTLHAGKNVFTMAYGPRRMYDFMDNNPSIEGYPVSHVNDPSVIAQNDNMISINAILEVDLMGQCNSEFLGGAQFSGTGGQLDYVRGAFNSKGGKSVLAFHSTASKGEISRVVARLKAGAVVTTPRMDTHFLVTEHGAVNLKGKSTRDRALAIIGIAHPKFRDQLLREAEDMYLL